MLDLADWLVLMANQGCVPQANVETISIRVLATEGAERRIAPVQVVATHGCQVHIEPGPSQSNLKYRRWRPVGPTAMAGRSGGRLPFRRSLLEDGILE